MTLEERAAELMDLAGIRGAARVAPRPLRDWVEPMGLSLPALYRKVEAGELTHLKYPGTERAGGAGPAGAVRVRAIDVFLYLASCERGAEGLPLPGAARRCPK